MKTRQIQRNSMRRIAELRGYKPSKYVHDTWERLQISLLGGGKKGVKRRCINQAKGTKPKRLWRMRVQAAVQ